MDEFQRNFGMAEIIVIALGVLWAYYMYKEFKKNN